jgi:hypothetical protein
MQAEGRTRCSEIHKFISSIWNKNFLNSESGQSVYPDYKEGDKGDSSNCKVISLLSTTYNMSSNIVLRILPPYEDEINVDFDITHQLLIIYSAFVIYLRKKKW